MSKLKLKTRIIIDFIGFITIILFANFLFFNSLKKVLTYRELIKQFYDFHITYAEFVNAQKDFLIHYPTDPIFFKTEQSTYLTTQEVKYGEVKTQIQNLLENQIILTHHINRINQIKNLVENTDNYFKQITHKLYLRGSLKEKSGKLGEIYDLFVKIEDIIPKEPTLEKYFQNAKVAFLKYANTYDEDAYREFSENITAANRYVFNYYYMFSDTTGEQFNLKAFTDLLDKLKNRFKELRQINNDLGISAGNTGLIGNWNESIMTTYNLISTVRGILMEKIVRMFKNIKIWYIIILITFLVLSTVAFHIILRLLTTRFREIAQYIEPLRYGELPKKIEVKFQDEIGELLETLNVFIEGMHRTTKFAQELGKGNFDVDFKPLSDRDVLGNALLQLREDLKRAQEEEEKRKQEERIRQWTNEGISKFAEILRQKTSSLQELASIVIKNLVNYLNANQGAFFYLNDEDKENVYLELLATYAYNKERKKKKTFKLGEGLVGTAVVEKATIYMTDIPEDYISITSGLGGATPRSLLIVPLKAEEEIVGAIEIASFNELKDYEIKFVEQVAESIAATVSITKINQRTAKLLEQSQMQAREMAAQEEEMRQNLEELKATQEEAARREAELRSLLNAIETATYVTVIDLNGFIIGANDRLLDKLGVSHDEYIGHHISEFDLEGKLADDLFWEDVKAGKTVHYVRHFKIDNKEFWFDEYYAPILDKQGNATRFIAISFDITPRILQQKQLEEQTQKLKEKEKELQKQMEELEKTKANLEKQKEKAEKLAKQIQANEEILKAALEDAREKFKEAERLSQELLKEKLEYASKYEDYLSAKELIMYLYKKVEAKEKELVKKSEEYEQKLAEKDKIIEQLQKQIEELKKRVEGSAKDSENDSDKQ